MLTRIRSWLSQPKAAVREWRRKRDNRIAMQYQRGLKVHWIDDVREPDFD